MADYKDTLNLPETAFPMRGNLPQREPEMLAFWEQADIYGKQRAAFADAPKFILHDGPPYANGAIHVGHALNKILKDIITKSRHLLGFNSPYIPGWDCHGLPIEQKVEQQIGKPGAKVSATEFRAACRAYAASQIELQKADFIRLGVFGDWAHPYLTMQPQTEAGIVRALRDIMALADAVNEYVDANKPWELAKQEGQDERLHEVCSELINAFTMLTAYLAPVLPQTAAKAARFLNLDAITWANTRETLGEHAINKYEHLMQRVEQKQVDDLIEANKQSIQTTPAPAAEESKYEKVAEQASFDDFIKIDMRVAKVLNCEAVEGSTKLLKFDLDFGFEKRIIFSGIAASYPNPAELNGRMVIAVANFAPRKMAKFGVSEGMILSAELPDGSSRILSPDTGAQPGDKVC